MKQRETRQDSKTLAGKQVRTTTRGGARVFDKDRLFSVARAVQRVKDAHAATAKGAKEAR